MNNTYQVVDTNGNVEDVFGVRFNVTDTGYLVIEDNEEKVAMFAPGWASICILFEEKE